MLDLAKVKNGAVFKPVPNPAPVAGFGFGGVHAADGRVLPAATNPNKFENHPEGPINSVSFNDFESLTCVGRMKCGGGKPRPTFHTAKIAIYTTLKLFLIFLLQRPFALAQISHPKAI